MLAHQNLVANNAFNLHDTENLVEVHALELSHSMMQKVLNDVLDLQRMDAGRFEVSNKPFALHRDIRSTLNSVRAATNAKHLELRVDLDEAIDKLGQSTSTEGLWVLGDSMRLRQVLTNLTSNAVSNLPVCNRRS